MAANHPKRAFISYSTLDRNDAFRIKRLLEAHEITVWLDVFDIRAAGKIQSDLLDIIGRMDLFCLLLSPNAVESRWVREEIAVAKSTDNLRILPVILRPCTIPTEIEDTIGFDAREGFDRQGVQDRFIQAVLGEKAVSGTLMLDVAERELQRDLAIQQQVESTLPVMMQSVFDHGSAPMRYITLRVDTETIPDDEDTFLELRLELDDAGNREPFRIFVARYREGATWPATLSLTEPEYSKFFLTNLPRIDVQFRWFDRTLPMNATIASRVYEDFEDFSTRLSREWLKPHNVLTIADKHLQIPSLKSLIDSKARFRLLQHSKQFQTSEDVGPDTDIVLFVECSPKFASADPERMVLYASNRSREDLNMLKTSSLASPNMIPILRSVLLSRCNTSSWKQSWSPRHAEVEAMLDVAIQKNEYDSPDIRRLAAYSLFDKGRQKFLYKHYKEAFDFWLKTLTTIHPLFSSEKLTLRDIVTFHISLTHVGDYWRDETRFEKAVQSNQLLLSELVKLANTRKESDVKRMTAEASFGGALLNLKNKGEATQTAKLLQTYVTVYERLHASYKSSACWLAWGTALTNAIRTAAENKFDDLEVVASWKVELRARIGQENYDKLITPASRPDTLPVWLAQCTLDAWPTVPVKSAALRYSMQYPARWSTDFNVRGVSSELEHVYRGPSDSSWLFVSFTENPNIAAHVKRWVDTGQLLMGTPALFELAEQPTFVNDSWEYKGQVPKFATQVAADECHAWTGVVRIYKDRSSLGRIYTIALKKGEFGWKITLCFATACFPGMAEDIIDKNDHVRAGAILGFLKLQGA